MSNNGMNDSIRITPEVLKKITNQNNERNMYVHPNFLARDMFWQRLEFITRLLKDYTKTQQKVLDLGGGSGMLCKPLSQLFNSVDIIDLDTSDAENVIEFYKLPNVQLMCEDIGDFDININYDVIVAADVLEHFIDLQVPLQFINNHLKKDALLVVSLPTENAIYVLGRKIIRKNKPLDHYHKSCEVLEFLIDNGFELIRKQYCPKYIFPIPLFEIAMLRKIIQDPEVI